MNRNKEKILGRISIPQTLALLLVMLAAVINSGQGRNRLPCGYVYFSKAGAWFKMHTLGAYHGQANKTCDSEGAQLASPTSEAFKETMMSLMVNYKNKYKKTSRMLVHTASPVAENLENHIFYYIRMPEELITVSVALTETGQLQIISRYTILPFICYKNESQDLQLNECGTTDSDYKLDNRTNKCYKFHPIRGNWVVAARICATEGGHLAVINSKEESEVVQEIFDRNSADAGEDKAFLGYWADDNRVWRTMQGRSLSESEFKGRWISGASNEPANSSYCGSVTHNGALDKAPCDHRLPFLCEKNKNSSCLPEPVYYYSYY